MVINFTFFLFSSVLILSALAVILSRNPIYSVLFLILAFFNSAGLFLLNNAEFLAMLIVIVYVGAVAMLFLFVIMMLNIEFKGLATKNPKIILFGVSVAVILFIEIILAIFSYEVIESQKIYTNIVRSHIMDHSISNSLQLGEILYTDFFMHFQIAAIILLVSMVGSVTLTLRTREGVRKQNIGNQIARKKHDSVKIVKVLSKKGI